MRRLMSLTVMAAALLLTGCGRTMQTPPPLQPVTPGTGSGYVDPGYNNGYPGTGNGYPGYGDPNAGNYPPGGGYYDPNNGSITAPMIAKIDHQKNGSVLGIGTFVVSVSVSNPSGQPQQGRLKVSILDNGDSIRDFTEVVTVPAGQTITRTYSDKRWTADNATASIQTMGPNDPYATNPGQNMSGGYNDPNAYNSGSYGSGYPSTGGYGSGYPSSGGYNSGYPSSGYGSGYPASNGYNSGYPSSGGYPSSTNNGYPY
jgi:hypothetical protein